jgi:hypothetical protein
VLKMKVLISDNSLSFDEIFERVLGWEKIFRVLFEEDGMDICKMEENLEF